MNYRYLLTVFSLILLDIFTITVITIVISYVKLFISKDIHINIFEYLWLIPIYILIFLYNGLYTKNMFFWEEILKIIKSIFLSSFIVIIILFLLKKSGEYSRFILIMTNIFMIVLFPIIHMLYKSYLCSKGILSRNIIIVGDKASAEKIYKLIKAEKNLCYKIVAILDDTSTKVSKIGNTKIHRGLKKIDLYIKKSRATEVIIVGKETYSINPKDIVYKIQDMVNNVIYIPNDEELLLYNVDIKYFFSEKIAGLEIKNNLMNPILYITKVILDYFITILILPVVILLMLFISIAIKIDSSGPIFFSQNRIGKKGKEFKCYKFRTMYVNSDKLLKDLLDKDESARQEWQRNRKLKNDPRITKIGRFLRKTSLDEIPQIFNVLKGDMSLVGPRPVTKEEIECYYKDKAKWYFSVKPGITGLWQISGRSNISYEDRVFLDTWYVRNWDIWIDILILIKTIKVVLRREGAY